jgi:hypothetical protein
LGDAEGCVANVVRAQWAGLACWGEIVLCFAAATCRVVDLEQGHANRMFSEDLSRSSVEPLHVCCTAKLRRICHASGIAGVIVNLVGIVETWLRTAEALAIIYISLVHLLQWTRVIRSEFDTAIRISSRATEVRTVLRRHSHRRHFEILQN